MDNQQNNKSDNQSKLMDHNYDGIQEFDNMLPRWWLMTFYATIIFSVFYYAYYELGTGPTLVQELQQEMADDENRRLSAPKPAFPDEQVLAEAIASSAQKTKGHEVYVVRCQSCHADKGQGLIGPNLTDKFWINGDGQAKSIAKVIHDGVAEKGMPAWGPVLKAEEVYAVTAFVVSLKGTNPAGAKAPQGKEYP